MITSVKRERAERVRLGVSTRAEDYWLCPWKAHLPGQPFDPWQERALLEMVTRGDDLMACCSRQVGKTEVTALASYLEAALGGFALIVSPSDDQSIEFFERMLQYHRHLALAETVKENCHELRLSNGGRILAVPNNEKTVRVYAKISLLIIDEAARVPDELFGAVEPMLAVARGRTVLLSTPFGKRGFFHREWIGKGSARWKRHSIVWRECPRITPEFIASQVQKHGEWWVQQEYECVFHETIGQVFDVSKFEETIDADLELIDVW